MRYNGWKEIKSIISSDTLTSISQGQDLVKFKHKLVMLVDNLKVFI
jgi:hypothetical protein